MAVLERRRREDPRRAATEQAFLRAAQDLLAEGAVFAELNVSRIAQRAGRTRTAFYAHFEDRRELLMRLIEEFAAEGRRALGPFMDGETPADVRTTVADLLEVLRRHGTVVRALTEAAAYDEEVGRFWDATIGDFVTATQDRLQRAGYDPVRAHATAVTLTWMTERACVRQVTGRETTVADGALVDALTETWWRAIAAPG